MRKVRWSLRAYVHLLRGYYIPVGDNISNISLGYSSPAVFNIICRVAHLYVRRGNMQLTDREYDYYCNIANIYYYCVPWLQHEIKISQAFFIKGLLESTGEKGLLLFTKKLLFSVSTFKQHWLEILVFFSFIKNRHKIDDCREGGMKFWVCLIDRLNGKVEWREAELHKS